MRPRLLFGIAFAMILLTDPDMLSMIVHALPYRAQAWLWPAYPWLIDATPTIALLVALAAAGRTIDTPEPPDG